LLETLIAFSGLSRLHDCLHVCAFRFSYRTADPVSRRFTDKHYGQRYKIDLNKTMKKTFIAAGKCLLPG
jgi:hypothetical protein